MDTQIFQEKAGQAQVSGSRAQGRGPEAWAEDRMAAGERTGLPDCPGRNGELPGARADAEKPRPETPGAGARGAASQAQDAGGRGQASETSAPGGQKTGRGRVAAQARPAEPQEVQIPGAEADARGRGTDTQSWTRRQPDPATVAAGNEDLSFLPSEVAEALSHCATRLDSIQLRQVTGISRKEMNRLIAAGELRPAYRAPLGRFHFYKSDVVRFLGKVYGRAGS